MIAVPPNAYSPPVPPRHPYLDWPGPIPFAHRGGTSSAPENTLAAFEHAVELGYRYLETDVHLTVDGVLVAFHDADLERTCGVAVTIAECTWAELTELRVDGREPIPSMIELLDAFPAARFNIDCKSDAAAPALVGLVRDRELLSRVCIGSFSHARITKLRSLLGRALLTCMSPRETTRLRITGRVSGDAQRVAQVPVTVSRSGVGRHITLVNERFVAAAQRRSGGVHVWTIDDPDEMHRLLELGVDGIMTDHPDVLRSALMERNEWYV